MKRFTLCLLLLSTSACSSARVKKVRTPSGKMGYSITCRDDVQNCYEKAGNVCPNGYQVVRQTESPIPQPIVDPVTLLTATNHVRINYFISCK